MTISQKKEKNKKEELWKWTKKVKVTKQEECHLVPEIQPNLNETVSPIEIVSLVTGLEELLKLLVEQSNLYADQNGRNFTVTKEELKAYLGINFVMAINKLPKIVWYWRVDNRICIGDIENTMIWKCFSEILQNLNFADIRKDDKTDKAFKMRPVIDHLNLKFSEVPLNDSEQSIDEPMVKFKGRSGMKQYIKSQTIKWGFKFWFRCPSKSGYLYQMDIYLWRKQIPEFSLGLGEEIVFQLTKDLKRSFCTVYFDNFFNSPKLIEKLFQKGIYGFGIVWANRKQMPKMFDDKQIKRGDCKLLFSSNTMTCKWMDNRPVLLLLSALEWMNDISDQGRKNSLKTKSLVPCPKVVNLYNSDMGGVDLMDQHTAAYCLDWKSSVRFYLHIFFDLMDIACFPIYNMKHPTNYLSLIIGLLLQKT